MLPLFLLYIIGLKWTQGEQESIAVVLKRDVNTLVDYIQITNPPPVVSGHGVRVHVEYRCTSDRHVGIELLTDLTNLHTHTAVKVFRKIWRCHKNVETSAITVKKVRLKLADDLAFNYNSFNRNVSVTSRSKLRAWVLEDDWWPMCIRQNNCFTRSLVKATYHTTIQSPFSRPYKHLHAGPLCKSWGWLIQFYATSFSIPKCPREQDVIHLIEYPVVVTGDSYGVFRKLSPYKNQCLESRRQQLLLKPRFTISMWLYMLEYCPVNVDDYPLCSIIHHVTWDGLLQTVLLFVTPKGRLHVQVEHENGQQSAGMTYFAVPKHEWIWLVLTINVNKFIVTVKSGATFNETETTEYSFGHSNGAVLYDDTAGLWALGGSEFKPSFRGYIGQATLYRNTALHAHQVSAVSSFHPMFELKLSRREERCSGYLDWTQHRFQLHRTTITSNSRLQTACRHYFVDLLASVAERSVEQTCELDGRKVIKHRKHSDFIIRKAAYTSNAINYTAMASQLFEKASALLEDGLANVPVAFPLLKQAACCGHTDAMYIISVILNNGIYVRVDQIQSQAYLMLAALEKHRLSALALGHKHRYGIDGVTLDWEQSYRYHKFVADTTKVDKELHKDTDVYTEAIRLTDEVALHEQTDEDGDVFHWMTHQAKQGVLSAQNRVGRALFWGHQGLKRNLKAAVEYFKMSAETGDAVSQYDYGIALLRGQGTAKDVDAGLEQLNKAAKQNNAGAITALGWHALTQEQDLVKAVEYYEQGFNLGSPDAAYNLGAMYLGGQYPGKPKDADKALGYFNHAGKAGQLDAGVAIAYMTIKGTGRQARDVYVAVEWARYIAEKNPAIGRVLRQAVQAYRTGRRDVSLLYYSLAADAGVEVGSFNMAWLCELNPDGITSFIEKDCVWSKYNISIHREKQFVDSYAYIKMGDYYWYGCQGDKDVTKATQLYAEAASKSDPQALFNLGFMVEEGVKLSNSVLRDIHVPRDYQQDNITLLSYLYSRCRDSRHSEAYLPCSIALWRVQLVQFWQDYQLFIKAACVTAVGMVSALSSYMAYHYNSPRDNMPDTNAI